LYITSWDYEIAKKREYGGNITKTCIFYFTCQLTCNEIVRLSIVSREMQSSFFYSSYMCIYEWRTILYVRILICSYRCISTSSPNMFSISLLLEKKSGAIFFCIKKWFLPPSMLACEFTYFYSIWEIVTLKFVTIMLSYAWVIVITLSPLAQTRVNSDYFTCLILAKKSKLFCPLFLYFDL